MAAGNSALDRSKTLPSRVRFDQARSSNVAVSLVKNFTRRSGCGDERYIDASSATVSPSTLTFTTSNWQTVQAVTVTGIPDSESGFPGLPRQ